ncbi:MAG: peptidase M24 [Nitrospinaceae bacterium]|nr:MAG: peptidase M24 [Nitrospinaceae bacterium]
MKKDDITLMVFPGSSGSPKKFSLPSKLVRTGLIVLIVLLVGFTGSSIYFTKKYIQLVGEQEEVAELRRESKINKIQVDKLGQQVKEFSTEMSRLERFANKLRVITDIGESPAPAEKDWGVGGPYGLSSQSFSTSLQREAVSMVERLAVNLDQLDQQAKVQAVSFQQLDEFFKNQKSFLSSTPSIWPTRGWVTSGFGLRKSPFTGLKEKHEGWDIGARMGSPIRASADGVVVIAGREAGYGKMLEVDHGYGITTRYGHNSKNLVKVGDRVKRGDKIGLIGSTGRSTGPHLHYEVRLNGVPVNPKNYILED